jgi:uncharacterized protein (TIGR00251 family)
MIKLRLHPSSSKEEIKKIDEGHYEVWIKEKPIDSKANVQLVKLMKKFLKKNVKIKSGFTSRNKVIEIS